MTITMVSLGERENQCLRWCSGDELFVLEWVDLADLTDLREVVQYE